MTGKKRYQVGIIAVTLAMGVLMWCHGSVRDLYRHSIHIPSRAVVMAGSTSMEKFANMLAECFKQAHPDMTVTAEFAGSSAGVQAVLAGRADIGMSSRMLTVDEKASGATACVIALDGIAVITDADNPTVGLTMRQLAGIYTGQVRNWQELGGKTQPIVVVGREAGSGTRSAFEELLEIREQCLYANELDSEGTVLARVAATPGAVGYVSFDVLDDTVHALSLDGVKATEEKVETGEYPLCRSLYLVTKGEFAKQRRQVQDIFAYLQTEEGKELVRTAGLIVPECP